MASTVVLQQVEQSSNASAPYGSQCPSTKLCLQGQIFASFTFFSNSSPVWLFGTVTLVFFSYGLSLNRKISKRADTKSSTRSSTGNLVVPCHGFFLCFCINCLVTFLNRSSALVNTMSLLQHQLVKKAWISWKLISSSALMPISHLWEWSSAWEEQEGSMMDEWISLSHRVFFVFSPAMPIWMIIAINSFFCFIALLACWTEVHV